MRHLHAVGGLLPLFMVLACTGCGSGSAASDPDASADGDDGSARGSVMFSDADSDFVTDEVHDADREVVTFDPQSMSMVWADGTRVSGWSAEGNDLDSTRSSVAFRVLFGWEAGETRAYFTETLTGTICNLTVFGPDQLSIAATDELPPRRER